MRAAVWTLAFSCMASTMGALPAAASDYTFCIRGCDFGGGVGDCRFSSYEQCRASASGREAICAANPYFSADARLQADQSRLSRRRF